MCLCVCTFFGRHHCSLLVALVLRIHHAKLTRRGRRSIPFVYFLPKRKSLELAKRKTEKEFERFYEYVSNRSLWWLLSSGIRRCAVWQKCTGFTRCNVPKNGAILNRTGKTELLKQTEEKSSTSNQHFCCFFPEYHQVPREHNDTVSSKRVTMCPIHSCIILHNHSITHNPPPPRKLRDSRSPI